jgi:hypothetical protein
VSRRPPPVSRDTIGEALPREIARVRDEVLPHYDAVPAGAFAAGMMRHDLAAAAKATTDGDVVAMIRAYKALACYDT